MVRRNIAKEAGLNDEIAAIREDLTNLREDVSDLINSVVDKGRKGYGAARERVQGEFEHRYEQIQDAAHHVKERAERATQTVQHQVQDHPFASIALAFGVGLLLGRVIRR